MDTNDEMLQELQAELLTEMNTTALGGMLSCAESCEEMSDFRENLSEIAAELRRLLSAVDDLRLRAKHGY